MTDTTTITTTNNAATTATRAAPRRKRRVVGNPLSRARRHHHHGLNKPGMVGVAALTILFATAAIYLVLVPLVTTTTTTTQQPRSSAAMTRSTSITSSSAAVATTGKLRRQAKRADWMEQQAEAQAEQVAVPPTNDNNDTKKDSILVLTLSDNLGQLHIRLRPDLSAASADYITQLVHAPSCDKCQFYRAERGGILQGIIQSAVVPKVEQRGTCPPGAERVPNDCPSWDLQCACHGPFMTHGMVAWAGGKTGPDFFINAYEQPVDIWGTQHTVWGELLPSSRSSSWAVMDKIWALDTKPKAPGAMMTFLEKPVSFTASFLETTSSQTLTT